ncbi:hypothetical protein BGW42_001141 [Actinomortierella wolfii]|nr:hypothetical protein BGW42_001141 [Actinomortierella wolfii]
MRGASQVESDDDDFAPPTPHNIRIVDSLPPNDNDNNLDIPHPKRGRSSSSTIDSIQRQRMNKKSKVDQQAQPHRSKTSTTATTATTKTITATRNVAKSKDATTATCSSTSTPPKRPRQPLSLARRRPQQQQPASNEAQTAVQTERVIVLDSASESEGEYGKQELNTAPVERDDREHSPILPPEVDEFVWATSNFGGVSSQLQQNRGTPEFRATHPSTADFQASVSRYTQDSIASSQGSDDQGGARHCQEQEHEEQHLSWTLSPKSQNLTMSSCPSPYDTIQRDSTTPTRYSQTNSSMATSAFLFGSTTQDDSFHVVSSDTEEISFRSTTVINECILCGKSLAHLDVARVEYHLNTCLDKQQSLQPLQISTSTKANHSTLTKEEVDSNAADEMPPPQDELEGSTLDMEQFSSSQRVFAGVNVDFLTVLTKCPICKSAWQQRASSSTPSTKARISSNPKAKRKMEHMKRCAKTHGQPIQALLYQLRLLKERHERVIMLGVSAAEEEDSHSLSQEVAGYPESPIINNSENNNVATATPSGGKTDNTAEKRQDDDESPLIDRRRKKRQAPQKPPTRSKTDVIRKQVISMADEPDDNFISDAITTSVQVQKRGFTAINNSVARAERLEQMHLDQHDEGLQLALAMSLSEAESRGESVERDVGEGASSSVLPGTKSGRRRRKRRPVMGVHETSVLPIEEVKVLIQEKVLSLLFPESDINSSDIAGGSDTGMANGVTTPPWRPSRFQTLPKSKENDTNHDDDSEQDSLVESFSQLSSDTKPPAPRTTQSYSSLWRISQIGDRDSDVNTMDLTKQTSATTNPPAVDQDIFVTEFMRRYIIADRQRASAQAEARGDSTLRSEFREDKILDLLRSAQACSDSTSTASYPINQHKPGETSVALPRNRITASPLPKAASLAADAAPSVEDEIVISDAEDLPLSPSLRYSRPPLSDNELISSVRRLSDRISTSSKTSARWRNTRREYGALGTETMSPLSTINHGEENDVPMDTGMLEYSPPPIEHSPILSPIQSPEPVATEFAEGAVSTPTTRIGNESIGRRSSDVIPLSSPSMPGSSSQPMQKNGQHQSEYSQDSSILISDSDTRDERNDTGGLPPPLDLNQLLEYSRSQPVPRSASMVEDFNRSPEPLCDTDYITIDTSFSDPRRLSLIREDAEDDDEQRRRSLSSSLGLGRHARGRSRSEEPRPSFSSSSSAAAGKNHVPVFASPTSQPPQQRRPNPLAGLPLRSRPLPIQNQDVPSPNASTTATVTSSSQPSPPVTQVLPTSRPAAPLQEQPSSISRPSRSLGRSVSTSQLPSSLSTLTSVTAGQQSPAPRRVAPALPQTPPSRSRTDTMANPPSFHKRWGGGRFMRRGGVAPISEASRERAGNLAAESARILAAFIDGQNGGGTGGVIQSQQSQADENEPQQEEAERQPLSQPQQPSQQQQMPDFEHMSMPRLRLAAISFGLRLTTKRKMVEELRAIWERMHAPTPPSLPVIASQTAVSLSQSSAADANINNGSIQEHQQSDHDLPSTAGRGSDGEDREDPMQENTSSTHQEDRGLQSSFIARQRPHTFASNRRLRVTSMATTPSTGRLITTVQTDESEQADQDQGHMGRDRRNDNNTVNANNDSEDEDMEDVEELEVLSPLDPDRMRMSMEDIIVPTSEDQLSDGTYGRADGSSSSQVSSAMASSVLPSDLDHRLFQFITSTPDLHHQCLIYKPLDLEDVWKRCQQAGIQVTRQQIRLFLDRRGIICFIPANSPLNSWRKSREKRQSSRRQQSGRPKQSRSRQSQRANSTTARSSSNSTGRRQQRQNGGEAQTRALEEDEEEDGERENEQANLSLSQPRPRPLSRRNRQSTSHVADQA